MAHWQGKLPWLVALLGLVCGGAAVRAASPSKHTVRTPPWDYMPVASETLAADPLLEQDGLTQDAEEDVTPFQEEPPVAPVPEDGGVAPLPPPEAVADRDDGSWGYATCGDLGEGRLDCGSGESCRCTHGRCPKCGGCLPAGSGIVFGGWIDQGVTVNSDHTASRFNGPVTFNDRDGEYQLNQLWVYMERAVDTGGYGWDIGGRVDFMYGTDSRFTTARGLELTRAGGDRWSTERFYGPALPQVYMDVGLNNWTVRMGHFFTIIGYESVMAPENFFYSHPYCMQYGEPFTHTGLLAAYQPAANVSLTAGFGRGWDNWEDNNDRLSFLGGLSWTSYDGATGLTLALSTGNYDDAGELNRTMYSLVFSHHIGPRMRYLLQYDWGFDEDGGVRARTGARQHGEWYGINQYCILDLNESWSFGLRVEWFRDVHGTRVGGLGAPHGWPDGPDVAQGVYGWAGDFAELAIALNWKPTDRVIVRPECRWDWYDGPRDALGRFPFDGFGTYKRDQFTFGTDLIITF